MFRIILGCLIVAMVACALSSVVKAETVILQSGQTIAGQIIERNELRVTIDVQGTPKTLFLGEIASIDGQPVGISQAKQVEMPQAKLPEVPSVKVVDAALAEVKKSNIPHYTDEHDSLERFMEKRKPNVPSGNNSVEQKLPPSQNFAQKTEAIVQELKKEGDTNKNAVVTPDGGVIVVRPDSIVKYDKDLNVVKKIDLKV